MCDRLRSVDKCTLNPPDQYGGYEMGLLGVGVGSLGAGVLSQKRHAKEEEVWACGLPGLLQSDEYAAGGVMG